MRRFAPILALSLMLAGLGTVTAQAASAPPDLTATYLAIFAPAPQAAVEPEPVPDPEPAPDPVLANIWCCSDTGSCVSTTADKCTNTYHGTQYATYRACLRDCP